ncbi:ccd4,nced4 [Castilleja foliolosa]|uniref:Ccd4,nced4 n=1 Tax=Castilleja foliolosa TaxID=1961234 RepID=A0ABD3DUK4_9LAMI
MDTLSSSFLQIHSLSSPPPLPLIQSKAPTFKVKVKCKVNTSNSSINATSSKPPKTRQKTNQRSLLTNFFISLDDFIINHIDPPLRPSIDPEILLSGNFAPVSELPPTACEVEEGTLPPCLDGAYIRNGPNPQFIPRGPYHLFDGDGMLHCIRISGGGTAATFCSRFVETQKYLVERETGSPVVINFLSAFTSFPASMARIAVWVGRAVSGQYDISRGNGLSNTSLACFGGNLFALAESDLPYRIKLTPDGDIITLGRHEDYGEPLQQMTAHPKVDLETGISSDGTKQPEVNIYSKNECSMVHDFAITKNYAIFPDPQIVIRPAEIIKGKQPVLIDSTKVPRLGIIPRYAVDERDMWWVEVPGLNTMHMVNAWEEDGGATIVLVAPNLIPVENVIEWPELTDMSMERIEINVKTKTVTTRWTLSAIGMEFGVINPTYVGKKTRYMYAGIVGAGQKMSGVAKVDLSLSNQESHNCIVARRLYGPGCYGGEPCFVPREPDNEAAEEDDGYILNYVFNEHTQESKLLVMDAKSPNLDIVAVVKLPQRVPYGFHGMFVRECEIQKLGT